MKKVEELKQRAEGSSAEAQRVACDGGEARRLEEQPRSLRSGGVCGGWVAGSFKSTIFKDLPEAVTGTMVPNVEIDDKNGWEYLKQLPLCRRLRQRLMRSRAWILNTYGGEKVKARKRNRKEALAT